MSGEETAYLDVSHLSVEVPCRRKFDIHWEDYCCSCGNLRANVLSSCVSFEVLASH